MDGMPTRHEHHRFDRGEHVLATDRTVGLDGALNASVVVLQLDGQTGIAAFTVEEVLTQAQPQPTDPTVVAMVNVFSLVVIVENTRGAVIRGELQIALGAELVGLLWREAFHTENIPSLISLEFMLRDLFVVTDRTAGTPFGSTAALTTRGSAFLSSSCCCSPSAPSSASESELSTLLSMVWLISLSSKVLIVWNLSSALLKENPSFKSSIRVESCSLLDWMRSWYVLENVAESCLFQEKLGSFKAAKFPISCNPPKSPVSESD
ncbi:hypothetical protein WICPIJ_007417 [Wickerhamomyces pijperi]|uniref:Uncharacterized protein n=1 Tax=Wickerhamomyces pijperi TaxID=599730 RepID=A0A9P8Q1V6_WICPI|nr:hypothetical protein WICPIJ_007417 [Wickerhamomyces pijperi]